MSGELNELLDTAIYKEIVSQAFYLAGQKRTQDQGARTLMEELAAEELRHSQWLKSIEEKGLRKEDWHKSKVSDLMMSEYLTGSDSIEGIGLQDTLTFAIKREQQAVEFYSKMMGVLKDEDAKYLCERLVHEELKHKLKLETFYDDMFYSED